MHFSFVLKQQVGRILLRVEFVFTLWSGEVSVAAQSPGLNHWCVTHTAVLIAFSWLMWSSMNEVTFRLLEAVVSKC